jgi:hypothetical protein
MPEDFDTTLVEFENIAAKIYSRIWAQFSEYVRRIDREEEQNVFRMQASKFADALKRSLNEEVKKALSISHSKNLNKLEAALSVRIDYYLGQFHVKCNSL